MKHLAEPEREFADVLHGGLTSHIRNGSFQTVSELATAVGFRSPSYFSRLYRAEFGDSRPPCVRVCLSGCAAASTSPPKPGCVTPV